MVRTLVRTIRKLFLKDYRIIAFSGIFDKDFLEWQVGVEHITDDPIYFYLSKKIPDYEVGAMSGDIFSDIITPHPFFDTAYYLLQYFPDGIDRNPFAHYLAEGWKSGFNPGPYFDWEIYRDRSGWCEKDGNPLVHFSFRRYQDGIWPGRLFDPRWYLSYSPHILPIYKKRMLEHYLLYGIEENKSPIPVFDQKYYKKNLERQNIAVRDPFSHFLLTAGHSNNRPNKWFDPDFYCSRGDERIAREKCLDHFLSRGFFQKKAINREIERLGSDLVVSVIVPVYNPEPHFLDNCIQSVVFQTYPHWQLCLADDCSTRDGIREQLEAWAARDPRIRVVYLEKNSGISGATAAAAALATGEFLGFLDNDDELTPDCLFRVVSAIKENGADLVYTDEDLIEYERQQLSVFRKSGFNSELLLSHNYITHFVVARKSLYDAVGGVDSAYDGAQDYDLLLKLTEQTDRIVHIDQLLYHWRALHTSTNINHQQKSYANEAGRKALQAALDRRQIKAVAGDGIFSFFYRLEHSEKNDVSVTILIQVDNSRKQRQNLERIVSKTGYENCCFILSDKAADRERTSDDTRIVCTDGKPSVAALSAESDFLLFLSAGITDVSTDWIEQLLMPFSFDDVAMVCGRITYDGGDGRSLTIPDMDDYSNGYFYRFLTGSSVHANGVQCLQQVRCCGPEMVMISTGLYRELGGVNEAAFGHRFGMVDLSLRITEKNLKIVYTPEAIADIHDASGKSDYHEQAGHVLAFREKWRDLLGCRDPFYNPGLLRDKQIKEHDFLDWLAGKKMK